MTDLTNILGGPWRPPVERRPEPPEIQVADAMQGLGITPPEDGIIMDGKIHRFNSGSKRDKSAWYVIYPDGVPAGRFGCWRDGIEQTFVADIGRDLSPAEQMAHTRRMAEAKIARDAEIAKAREVAADTVLQIWTDAGTASPDHPYLKRKSVQPHGARVTGDGRLIVPLYDEHGELSSLQYIDANGGKLYHKGGATGGRFWSIGAADNDGPIYVAEGFATAATIHEETGRPCFIAYSASNIVPTVGYLRQAHADVVIVADNDKSGVGQRYAEQAAAKYGARVIVPPEPGDANDYAKAGHDLAALLQPRDTGWLVPADDFCSQPSPVSWLIKGWIQQQAMIMVHGPSGGGKTFVVLDMCLRIAAGQSNWMGSRVHNGPVVYLAGEGHHGLRGRVAAWKHHNSAGRMDMWLSRDGCDLNTPAGYQRVAESIRALPATPGLIVVDTLHRFLSGDENSAQDTKTMLDACSGLMGEFSCSVLLVHHTGVSDEAQHRARGSSAWRGALDIEISVVPSKNEGPIEIIQRKSKDAELSQPLYGELQSVAIPGWIDEDGEPVTSAVLVGSNAPPPKSAKDSKIDIHRRTYENAWFATNCEVSPDGRPYVSRSAMKDYLVTHHGVSDATAKSYCGTGKPGRLVSDLLASEIIRASDCGHGWVVIDENQASAMLIRREK